MSDNLVLEYLPANHAVQRIGPEVREALVEAQRSAITRDFNNAGEFAQRVCDDLKLDLELPEQFPDSPRPGRP